MVLFWDIDGTLLTTAKAGAFAWDDSVREVTGCDYDLKSVQIAGLTDYQIAVNTFKNLGINPTPDLVERLVHRYEELLPSSLPRRKGRVLDNVREVLEYLRLERQDICSYLLTGNTRVGARAKLVYYDLVDYFPEGAFCEDVSDRATIAKRAVKLARSKGEVAKESMFVIGDTPHDIKCARAISARTIAVATGGYSVDELSSYKPWHLCARLPSPKTFVQLLDSSKDTQLPIPSEVVPPHSQ